jgi:ssDNA-binding Zn-finger/Zn-ribbon topoisomerase 1
MAKGNMKKPTPIFVLGLALATMASLAWAGASFVVTCKHQNCGFRGTADFGGGRTFAQLTGYCTNCGKFVALRWTREGRGVKDPKPKPSPAGRIWDASTGRTNDLYACPTCTNAFLPIASEKELRFCPKCGQESLKMESGPNYD